MKNYPNIINVAQVLSSAKECAREIKPGHWVPARPLGYQSIGQRFKAAWLVFTGKADALTWQGQ